MVPIASVNAPLVSAFSSMAAFTAGVTLETAAMLLAAAAYCSFRLTFSVAPLAQRHQRISCHGKLVTIPTNDVHMNYIIVRDT